MWKLRFLELWCWGSLSSWGARGGQKWEEVEGTCQKWEEVEETWEGQKWEAVVAAAEGENMRQLMMDLAPTEHSQVIPHQIITEGSPDLPKRMNFGKSLKGKFKGIKDIKWFMAFVLRECKIRNIKIQKVFLIQTFFPRSVVHLIFFFLSQTRIVQGAEPGTEMEHFHNSTIGELFLWQSS